MANANDFSSIVEQLVKENTNRSSSQTATKLTIATKLRNELTASLKEFSSELKKLSLSEDAYNARLADESQRLNEIYKQRFEQKVLEAQLITYESKKLSGLKAQLKEEEKLLRAKDARFKHQRAIAVAQGESQEQTEEEIKNLEEIAKLTERQKKLNDAIANVDRKKKFGLSSVIDSKKEAQKNLTEQIKELIGKEDILRSGGDDEAADSVLAERNLLSSKLSKLETMVNVLNVMSSTLSSIRTTLDSQIDDAMATITQYTGSINTRLWGSSIYGDNTAFDKLSNFIENNYTGSPYVSQKKVWENIDKLVTSGVAFDIEERAAIMALSDRISTTFNALDENLNRLIRLQQTDLTYAALGSETMVTTLLNRLFNDSSYMNSLYKNVSDAIIDANSQVNADQATAFSYAVQKWLGSLYSVGMSTTGVDTLAKSINYLASGDVSSLNGNSAMQTLLGLAAQRAGISYASLLTDSANATTINELLKGMVEYLKDIAANTSNQVTRSAWANILGMSVSDLTAISNLTAQDIQSIYGSNTNYSTSVNAANEQLQFATNRTRNSIQSLVENSINNALFSFGMEIAKDDVDYVAWKAGEMLLKLGNVFGGVVGAGLKGVGSVALGLVGIDSLLNMKDNVSASLRNGLGTGVLSSYDDLIVQSRGANLPINTSSGLSLSAAITNRASSDVLSANFMGAAQKTSSAYTNTADVTAGSVAERTISDLYYMLFEARTVPIRVQLALFEEEALQNMAVSFGNNVRDTRDVIVDGVVRSDIIDSDMNAIKSNIYSVRSW